MLRTSTGFGRLELRVSGRIVVLASMGTRGFSDLGRDVTWDAWRRFEQLSLDRRSAADLRAFWSRYRALGPRRPLSDQELQAEVGMAANEMAKDPRKNARKTATPSAGSPTSHR